VASSWSVVSSDRNAAGWPQASSPPASAAVPRMRPPGWRPGWDRFRAARRRPRRAIQRWHAPHARRNRTRRKRPHRSTARIRRSECVERPGDRLAPQQRDIDPGDWAGLARLFRFAGVRCAKPIPGAPSATMRQQGVEDFFHDGNHGRRSRSSSGRPVANSSAISSSTSDCSRRLRSIRRAASAPRASRAVSTSAFPL